MRARLRRRIRRRPARRNPSMVSTTLRVWPRRTSPQPPSPSQRCMSAARPCSWARASGPSPQATRARRPRPPSSSSSPSRSPLSSCALAWRCVAAVVCRRRALAPRAPKAHTDPLVAVVQVLRLAAPTPRARVPSRVVGWLGLYLPCETLCTKWPGPGRRRVRARRPRAGVVRDHAEAGRSRGCAC